MKTPKYTRGQYKITDRKTVHVYLLIDEIMDYKLKQLATLKHKNKSRIIREALTEYYARYIQQ